MSKDNSYKYPENTPSTDYSSKLKGTENIKSILTNKRVLSLIGIILLAVFFTMRAFSSKNKKHEVKQAPPIEKLVVPEIKNIVVPPVVPPVLSNSDKVVVNVPVKNNIPDVNVVRLKDAENKIELLQKEIDAQNNSISSIQSDLDLIINKLTDQANHVYNNNVITIDNKSVSLYALTYGRAWIKADDKLYTVTLGDVLSGYGTVSKIDNDKNFIEFDSGNRITFYSGEM